MKATDSPDATYAAIAEGVWLGYRPTARAPRQDSFRVTRVFELLRGLNRLF